MNRMEQMTRDFVFSLIKRSNLSYLIILFSQYIEFSRLEQIFQILSNE